MNFQRFSSRLKSFFLKASIFRKNSFKLNFNKFCVRNATSKNLFMAGTVGFLGMTAFTKTNTYEIECQGTRIDYSHPNVTILNHRLVPILISKLRDPECSPAEFRQYSDRIMHMLIEEALGNEPMTITTKKTLAGGEFDHYQLKYSSEEYCAVTIIRAGDSMLQKMFDLMPGIKVGKILVQRDENSAEKLPIFYYSKLPASIFEKRVFILDPMLGTGGSCKCVVQKLLERGVPEKNITFVNLISCPEGLKVLTEEHPEMKIITAVVDPKMNENKYIVPGLGDFGDRFFNSD